MVAAATLSRSRLLVLVHSLSRSCFSPPHHHPGAAFGKPRLARPSTRRHRRRRRRRLSPTTTIYPGAERARARVYIPFRISQSPAIFITRMLLLLLLRRKGERERVCFGASRASAREDAADAAHSARVYERRLLVSSDAGADVLLPLYSRLFFFF